MFDATVEFAGPMLISFLNAGVIYPRVPDRHHAITPYGVFECADEERVLLAVERDSEWQDVAAHLLGDPGLGDDPRFATPMARLKHRTEVEGLVAAAIAKLDAEAAVRLFDDLGLAYASLNDMAEVSRHPVIADRRIVSDAETAGGAPVKALVGLAERLFETSLDGRNRPPELGEDTDSLLEALGMPPVEAP